MDRHGIGSLDELQRRSTEDVAWFTDAVIKFLGIEFQRPYTQVVDWSGGIQFPVWCVGGQLNIAHSCVDKWVGNPETARRPALIWEGEEGPSRVLSYSELAGEVNRCANALRALGLGKGDVAGLFMPMIPEIVIALLAIARIGGIILPLFSGYGAKAVADRLNDSDARALVTADGFYRRGKVVPVKQIADQALHEAPAVEHVLVATRVDTDVPMTPGRDHFWHELVGSQSTEAPLEITSAEDPVMIIYTSGTSGRPKGALHTHCGFPIKSAQDMAFGTDVHEGDVIYWPTDMGWMMGPWLVFGATLLGATGVIYDGALDYPKPDRLWSLAERHKVNALGVSPSLIRALIPHGEEYVRSHQLESIRCFASTGEPWNPDPWLWLFNAVGQGKRPIINYSGGTEISGGIVMGNPLTPLKPMAFSGPCPGMAADVVDDDCRPVRNAVGELVVRAPWIGMTRGFWKDRQRYLDAYWSRWENVWCHGDWAAIDDDGLYYILGRSDDTIKVAGKRVGPAEIESVLVGHPAVSEAAAIGIPHEAKGSEVVCFCVLTPGHRASDELGRELITMVATELGKPLQPKRVEFVSDLPRTRNGKIMRRLIRSAYLGEAAGESTGLDNPQAVDEIRRLAGHGMS